MPSCLRPAFEPVASLIQIHHGYSTECHHLLLSVETDGDGWSARVRGDDGRTLYAAHRASAGAAKTAAVEFAFFQTTGRLDSIAPHLRWSEYW